MIRFQSDHLIEKVWNNISEIIIYLFSVKFRYILNLLFNSIFFSFCKRTGFERKVNKSSFNFFFLIKKGLQNNDQRQCVNNFQNKTGKGGFYFLISPVHLRSKHVLCCSVLGVRKFRQKSFSGENLVISNVLCFWRRSLRHLIILQDL